MYLPFIQVAVEVIEQQAPDVALVLGLTENEVLGGLTRLFRWGLGRVPEGELPSAHDVVEGPVAAKLIARATRFDLDPERVIAALEHCAPEPLIERVGRGLRICGLGRYDAAVENAETRSEKAKHAANARWEKERAAKTKAKSAAADAPGMPDACPGRARPVLGDAKIETKTQTHITTTTADGPWATPRFDRKPVVGELAGSVSGPEPDDSPGAFKAWWRAERARRHPDLGPDSFPNNFDDWHGKAFAEVGFELGAAASSFLEDDHFRRRNWVIAVFMAEAVWRSRVPTGPAPPARDALSGVRRSA